ncbi:GRB10-interacting GYF protein 2-like [Paramacrobiotus metropolitanus]|uniref:GRB10-interacting GYF protein 2-like n=1 Tax=Paramacrobiotus metropolitanus TaxID=2943436 RepID=UPI0024458531|nr:GRB10-interacting GYF protein 2-like [Paramacrobiotus metropolitanus]XP_055354182.1 GRB10-interacting GYF protein 2-like [Paramacrobiotus metropolitanus]XP_055354183.1 GRB10-interacting GYF protein 2-like [Paramacrobiotus metropolitanus]
MLLTQPPTHAAPFPATVEIMTPNQWLHIRHLAQPPLYTAHTCADHDDDPFSKLVVTTSPDGARRRTSLEEQRAPPEGYSLSDVDLSGADGRGNYQGEVTTACHEMAVKDRMAMESAKLKATWRNLHKADPEKELRINRERLDDLDKDNIADLQKHTAARAFEILQKARNTAFNNRDEIKTLKRALMETDALNSHTAQSTLSACIKCRQDARDQRIFQQMIDHDNALVEKERQEAAERKQQLWADGEELREYLSGHRPVHEPPLRHDFGYIHRQAQHIREHNEELEKERQMEEAEREVAKGHFRKLLDEQRRLDDEVRRKEDEEESVLTMMRRAFIKEQLEKIIHNNEYEAQLERDKVDKSSIIVQLAEERRIAAEAIQREWDDAAGAKSKEYLDKQDAILAEKLRKRQEDIDDCTRQRGQQVKDAAEMNELEKSLKQQFAEKIIADVAAFHGETKEKEEEAKKGRKDWKNIWQQQKAERDIRDAALRHATDQYARDLRQQSQQHKHDFLRHAHHLMAHRQQQDPRNTVKPLQRAVEQILPTFP